MGFLHRGDLVLALPMLELSLFALGILIIDLFLPREYKSLNAWIAFAGLVASGLAVFKIQREFGKAQALGENVLSFPGFMNSLLVDRVAIFFFYLFLTAAAITILMSVRYLEVE